MGFRRQRDRKLFVSSSPLTKLPIVVPSFATLFISWDSTVIRYLLEDTLMIWEKFPMCKFLFNWNWRIERISWKIKFERFEVWYIWHVSIFHWPLNYLQNKTTAYNRSIFLKKTYRKLLVLSANFFSSFINWNISVREILTHWIKYFESFHSKKQISLRGKKIPENSVTLTLSTDYNSAHCLAYAPFIGARHLVRSIHGKKRVPRWKKKKKRGGERKKNWG